MGLRSMRGRRLASAKKNAACRDRPTQSVEGEMSDLKRVFERIAATNHWGSSESRSGAGSTLRYTYNLRRELETFVQDFDLKTMFDAPCGDFHWMKEVGFPGHFEYIGGDVAPSLIQANTERHLKAGRQFREFDITRDAFPNCDVWFCRDCLFHLPFDLILQALTNFCRSNIRFVMMTNHINVSGFKNEDIESGGFRLLDLFIEPFHLPRQVLHRVADYVFPFPQREMCVWSRDQIAGALQGASLLAAE
jgi:hypothetical protein